MSTIIDPAGTGQARVDELGRRFDELVIEVYDLPRDPHRGRTEALAHVDVPPIGKEHPSWPEIVVIGHQVTSTSDPTTKRVTVSYGPPPPPDLVRPTNGAAFGPVRWSTAVRTITAPTSRDWQGNWMLVRYAGVPVLESINANTGELIGIASAYYRAVNLARVDKPRTLLVLIARRWERDLPERLAFQIVNRTNRTTWRGYPPQAVYCDGVFSEPDTEGGYRVEYQFTVSDEPQGWRHESAIKINGAVPLDAVEGNGVEYFEIHEPVSFSGLDLE